MGIRGSLDCWSTGRTKWSCARGMIHNKSSRRLSPAPYSLTSAGSWSKTPIIQSFIMIIIITSSSINRSGITIIIVTVIIDFIIVIMIILISSSTVQQLDVAWNYLWTQLWSGQYASDQGDIRTINPPQLTRDFLHWHLMQRWLPVHLSLSLSLSLSIYLSISL